MINLNRITDWEAFFRSRQSLRYVGKMMVNRQDGSVLVHIPAGTFEMGDGEHANAPKHKVELSEYWIGVNGVTNRQYEVFVKATNHRKPGKSDYGMPIWTNGTYPADKADHPVVNVTWHDAAAYAEWAGGTLPTEAQWEKAAKGPLGLKYPWGTEWKPDLCRNRENTGPEETARVSAYPKGVSGYGTYQQSGNIWEWCQDWYDVGYYGNRPTKDPGGAESGRFRVNRGGACDCADSDIFRAGYRYRLVPDYPYVVLGFRFVRAV